MQRDRKSADESEIKTTAKEKLGDYRERRKMECESERWRERKERFFSSKWVTLSCRLHSSSNLHGPLES